MMMILRNSSDEEFDEMASKFEKSVVEALTSEHHLELSAKILKNSGANSGKRSI